MRNDSFTTGVLYGLLWAGAGFALWIVFEYIAHWLGPAATRLEPPRIQLILLAAAMIHFRFMLVKWKTVRAAKGMFVVLFITMLLVLINHRYSII